MRSVDGKFEPVGDIQFAVDQGQAVANGFFADKQTRMIGLILLIALIKVSLHYNNPIVLAVIYTVATSVFSAMFGVEFTVLFISATITFGMTWLFFWLLDKYEDSSVWWAIAIVFPALLFVLSFVQ